MWNHDNFLYIKMEERRPSRIMSILLSIAPHRIFPLAILSVHRVSRAITSSTQAFLSIYIASPARSTAIKPVMLRGWLATREGGNLSRANCSLRTSSGFRGSGGRWKFIERELWTRCGSWIFHWYWSTNATDQWNGFFKLWLNEFLQKYLCSYDYYGHRFINNW